jgi:nitrate reductase gamma subunit
MKGNLPKMLLSRYYYDQVSWKEQCYPYCYGAPPSTLPALVPLTPLTDLVVYYFGKATPHLDSQATALGHLHNLHALSIRVSSQLLTDKRLLSFSFFFHSYTCVGVAHAELLLVT